jgi:hypothetical protein
MRKGHPWDDLIFRALRHAWLFDAYEENKVKEKGPSNLLIA